MHLAQTDSQFCLFSTVVISFHIQNSLTLVWLPWKFCQGCRSSHASTLVACGNGVGRIQLTCSQAWLACSYFARAKPSKPDVTHRNRTWVNSYCLLLSSFVRLASMFGSVGSLLRSRISIGVRSKFVSEYSQYVAVAAWLQQQSASSKKKKKSCAERSGKQIHYMKKKQKKARLLEVGSQC